MITNVQKISHAGLDDLLKGFYNLTGLKICVYDADGVEISYYPDRYTSFCGYLRQGPRPEGQRIHGRLQGLRRFEDLGGIRPLGPKFSDFMATSG